MTEAEWRRFAEVGGLQQFARNIPAAPPTRACYWAECGKVLDARAGFIETIHQPDGLMRDFCSAECLHWQLHEDEKAE